MTDISTDRNPKCVRGTLLAKNQMELQRRSREPQESTSSAATFNATSLVIEEEKTEMLHVSTSFKDVPIPVSLIFDAL